MPSKYQLSVGPSFVDLIPRQTSFCLSAAQLLTPNSISDHELHPVLLEDSVCDARYDSSLCSRPTHPSILLLSSWFPLIKLSFCCGCRDHMRWSGVVCVRDKGSSGSYHSLPPGSQLLTLFTLSLCSRDVNIVPVRHESQCVKAL